VQGVLNLLLRLYVHRTRRLIKDEDSRIVQHRPGDGNALPLAT
jgi:hypothetical protein